MKQHIRCRRLIIFCFAMLQWLACSSGGGGPSFEDLINEGWAAFAQGDYQLAIDRFTEAETKNEEDAEANTGLGWSQFQADALTQAESAFRSGSSKMNTSPDLFAGWAFVLNALKRYSESNQRADQALAMAPSWSFSHGLPLDASELQILRAENYFLQGLFAEALTVIQDLNASFTVDVATTTGQAALAAEIERLKLAS